MTTVTGDVPTPREATKRAFLDRAGLATAERLPLPGDASTRTYERLRLASGETLMLMDQPPALESKPCPPEAAPSDRVNLGYNAMARLAAGKIEAFVAAAGFLRDQGLSAPKILEVDAPNGLLVSEDLGDGLFAHLIAAGQVETPLYLAAIDALVKLHEVTPPETLAGGWPLLTYDNLALKTGADLFVEWYPLYAGLPPLSTQALADWEGLWAPIRQAAERDASVFIHRDYHAENLLWLPERQGIARVGMIDFQDALKAHASWDLLSLLQDARRDVSPELEALCLEHYFKQRPGVDREAFLSAYAGLATLNEARILGIFARLVYRDKKPKYEAFMPRMWSQLSRNLKSSSLAGLKSWFVANGFGEQVA